MDPCGGATALAELDDPLLILRWRAMFKGGIYGLREGQAFLLLPRPAYGGAEKLELDGDWLLISAPVLDEHASPRMRLRPVARFNRRSNLFRWLIPAP